MKPGDLINLRTQEPRMVYFNGGGSDMWEPGEVGIFLGGHDSQLGMLEVLFKGHLGWVDEDIYVSVVDDPA